MAKVQMLRGQRANLGRAPFKDGCMYFTQDDGKLWIDSRQGNSDKRTCINEFSTIKEITKTLTADSWNQDTRTYTISFQESDGVKATSNGIISIAQGATNSQYETAKGAALRILEQRDNQIKLAATGSLPTVNIPVTLLLFN